MQRSSIDAVVGELVAARVAQHVRVHLDGEPGGLRGFVAVGATLKITWLRSDAIVAFSVITGDRMTSYRRGSDGTLI